MDIEEHQTQRERDETDDADDEELEDNDRAEISEVARAELEESTRLVKFVLVKVSFCCPGEPMLNMNKSAL